MKKLPFSSSLFYLSFFVTLFSSININWIFAPVEGFTTLPNVSSNSLVSTSQSFLGQKITNGYRGRRRRVSSYGRNGSTELGMFIGNSGILGVGTPEVITIVLIGYFLLGPTELYKSVKEIGKLINSFRTLSSEAAKNFEDSMEDQLNLDEIRKTQRELNDAFNFRRSINVPENYVEESFLRSPNMEKEDVSTNDDDLQPKKKIRKRIKRKETTQVPVEENISTQSEDEDTSSSPVFEEEKLTTPTNNWFEPSSPSSFEEEQPVADNWFDKSSPPSNDVPQSLEAPSSPSVEQSRFALQMSEQWNDHIMSNESKLSPLSKVMERIAILEEERKAAELRLEEEFRSRADLEEKYYMEKKLLLENAANEIQSSVLLTNENDDEDISSNSLKEESSSSN